MTSRLDAVTRHALFGLQKLVEANDLYLAGGAQLLHGLEVFDKEWGNISAAQKRLAMLATDYAARGEEISEEKKLLVDFCNAYPDAGAYILLLRLPPYQRIAWLEAALSASRTLGNELTTQAHLGNLGLSYLSLGQTEKAIEVFQKAVEIAEEIADARHVGVWSGNLGNAYAALGEHRQAILFHEKHLASAQEVADLRGQGHAYANLGVSHAELANYDKARGYYEAHLDIARELGDKRDEAHALFSLGITAYQEDHLNQAEKLLADALKTAQEIDLPSLEALALGGQADVSLERGRHEEAIALLEKALMLIENFSEIVVEMRLLESLGNVYSDLNDLQKALTLYQRKFSLAERSNNKSEMCRALGNQVSLYRELAAFEPARQKAKLGLEIAKKIQQRSTIAFIYWQLGLMSEAEGKFLRAQKYMQACLDFEQEANHPDFAKNQTHFKQMLHKMKGV